MSPAAKCDSVTVEKTVYKEKTLNKEESNEILNLLLDIHENYALLSSYAALSGNSLSTFREIPSVPSSRVNTLRTGDADLRFYITTVQDG